MLALYSGLGFAGEVVPVRPFVSFVSVRCPVSFRQTRCYPGTVPGYSCWSRLVVCRIFFCNLFWCIAPENSNQSEMPQCVGDTVVVDGVRHVIRGLFHLVRGIAHRDADSRMAQHRNVVAAVSERHRFAERNVVPGQDFVDARCFCCCREY